MKKQFCTYLPMYAVFLTILATDCQKEKSAGDLTSCSTQAATNILSRCATLNGTVTHHDLYGSTVTFEYGLTTGYGMVAVPMDKYLSTGTAEIFADVTGLSSGTTYHFRIKAVNNLGTVYGDDLSFSTSNSPSDHTGETGTVEDADGNVYHTIGIGFQIWMAENLKTSRYRNRDLIGTTAPSTFDISGESLPRYQWAYDGNESNVSIYGRLYTWFAVTDSRNVCPDGWHVPTDGEWTILTDYLLDNCYGYIGNVRTNIARSMAVQGWYLGFSTSPGNNTSGFTALPGGYRENDNNNFYGIGADGYWWSSTAYSTEDAIFRAVSNNFQIAAPHHERMKVGYSVRCVKD